MSRLLTHILKKQCTLPNSSTCSTIHHARHYAEDVAYTSEGLFTTEHEEMKRTLRKIIEKDINPFVDEWENNNTWFPAHQVFKKLGDAGLLGLTKPAAYGGMELDYTFSVAFAEECGSIDCGGVPMAIGVQTDMATPALAKFGSDALRSEYLAPTIAGDYVCCIGVSEPTAGSDVANIQTKAVKQGDDYIINGSKMWITNGMQADWICLLANTSDGNRWTNKSLIVVPLNAPGVTRAKNITKLGMHSSDTAILYFEDVRVPQTNRIGDEGKGFMYQMMQFQEERLFATAEAIRPMERIIDDTIEQTRTRHAFGAPLLNNQVIAFRLAELKTEVEAVKSLLYRATRLYREGEDVTLLASMGKLKAGRLMREVADSCLQYWGGMGYTDEVLISRFLRDGRLFSIGGGADEVMLSIICKYMNTLPTKKVK